MERIPLFVPGRLCLFGEHSDWAGGHRRTNPSVVPGACLLTGTDQGLRATAARRTDGRFRLRTPTDDGEIRTLDVAMDAGELRQLAAEGGFFSYAAGVALQLLEAFGGQTGVEVKSGLDIEVLSCDLPVKKGLSSSAAVCVLVARAFSLAHNLGLSTEAEMDYAYRGETSTPSRCGRMDQGCAFGSRPVLMSFDGDAVATEALSVGADFHLAVVDLNRSKDTVRILAALNAAYPSPACDDHHRAHAFLGSENARIVDAARAALAAGDPARLGSLMSEAQSLFDASLAPLCPDQLSAPALHELLSDPEVLPLVYGGKGVGSGGDGSAQFVGRSAEHRDRLLALMAARGLTALPLTVPRTARRARRAVITAAGRGTRLYPLTKLVRKEFLPVPDGGIVRPLIWKHVSELLDAGIEEVVIVAREGEEDVFRAFFSPEPELEAKLDEAGRAEARRIADAGKRVRIATQSEARGLGHAVMLAEPHFTIPGDTVVVLGDHWFRTSSEKGCVAQVLDAHEAAGQDDTVGLVGTPESDLGRFGFAAGGWVDPGRTLRVAEVREKPDPEYARAHLTMDGVTEQYLSFFGIYIYGPHLFEELRRLAAAQEYERGELQLTTAIACLLAQRGLAGFVVQGEKVDVGVPAVWQAPDR
ncbi:GHMP kinases putative ATP-binding protein [Hyaloraphidium curvatum]|nr:GHMP kinases putative ATP-binding protein [Hyaloraphidium curvatum]